MKTTEIIRAVLDIIDNTDDQPQPQTHTQDNDESRFRSILAMLQNRDHSGYDNAPNEVIADVDSVTKHAGGGLNGPKHQDDIRVKDPKGFS